MVFTDSLNTSGTIYQIINGMTVNTTGSDLMTVLLIFIMLILIGLILRMNVELIAILMLPLVLVLMAFDNMFMPIGALWLIFMGIILSKNLLMQRF